MDTRFAFTLELHQDKTPGIGIVTGLASRGHVQLAARDPQTYDMWQDGLRALVTTPFKRARLQTHTLTHCSTPSSSVALTPH